MPSKKISVHIFFPYFLTSKVLTSFTVSNVATWIKIQFESCANSSAVFFSTYEFGSENEVFTLFLAEYCEIKLRCINHFLKFCIL